MSMVRETDGLVPDTPSPMLQPWEVYDRDLFELEMIRVFGRSWVWLGDTEDLQSPGDFLTGRIGAQSVLVVRTADGEIKGFTGLLEVKCPKSSTHLGYVRARQVPGDYLPQITHNLWITGAAWCDFVSYDPRLGPGLDLFLVRVQAADVDLQAYEIVARLFLSEVEREREDVEALRRSLRAAA